MTRRAHWIRRDEGGVSLLVLVLAFSVIIMIGLAVDGGGKMRALERADNIAAEAARTAGQAIQLPQAVTGGDKVIDPDRAVAAAQAYLATAPGVVGHDVTWSPDGRRVVINVTINYDTQLLGIIGINQMAVTGTATAELVTG
jgi:Flp pilus assembly protein TadG